MLLRALEPVTGIADKTWGPGLLCRAMGIDKRTSMARISAAGALAGAPAGLGPPAAADRPRQRIGVDYAGEWARRPWRFYDRDSRYVSTASARLRAGAVT